MTRPHDLLQNLMQRFRFSAPTERQEDDLEKIAAQEQKIFRFKALLLATRNFHADNRLGEGGFGPVYKGRLEDGKAIAVKRLSRTSKQGIKEFKNEAKLLAHVQHRNIVNLVGYCVHELEERLLVYEYVANESLDKHLFKSPKRNLLDWKRRYKIIDGIARGLLYLHEDSRECMIHRDIKASNVLLDDKWAPKIADFGMAKLFPEDETHVNTRVAGTNGYMAPEYVLYGNLSVKADVYSFGVLVLEIISSQRNWNFNGDPDSVNLLEWAYKLYKRGKGLEVMDPLLTGSADPDQVANCIQIGLLCTQSDPKLRPTMRQVVVMLPKRLSKLDEPTRPGYPGTRHISRRRPAKAGSPHRSHSNVSGFQTSTITNTNANTNSTTSATGTTSAGTSSISDRYGKRPMHG